jgi:tetratricopeptide (TPR) repeat protein
LYCHRAVARHEFEDLQGAVDDYQKAANIYFDKQDWDNYRKVLDKVKQLQSSQAYFKTQRFDSSLNREPQVWSNYERMSELQNRLLRLVGGYWDVAERLIDLAKRKNPGMPEDWYWEKVIEDIESDR